MGTGAAGQPRSSLSVILLGIVTLGIDEMKRWSGRGVGGGIGLLLAIFVGFVNWFLLPSEIAGLYRSSGREAPVSGLTGLWILLPVVGGIIWVVKVQGALNRFWTEAPGVQG